MQWICQVENNMPRCRKATGVLRPLGRRRCKAKVVVAELGNWFYDRAIHNHRQSTADSTFRPPPSQTSAKFRLDIGFISLEYRQRFIPPFTLFSAMTPTLTQVENRECWSNGAPLLS